MQKLEEVDRLVKELSAKEKALHVLVNNAGAAWGDSIDDYPVRRVYSGCVTVLQELEARIGESEWADLTLRTRHGRSSSP